MPLRMRIFSVMVANEFIGHRTLRKTDPPTLNPPPKGAGAAFARIRAGRGGPNSVLTGEYDLEQLAEFDAAPAQPARAMGLGSRALRNTVLVLSAKVVARLIALVAVLYMIRLLGKDHYG